jgi:hypothetical protein
MMDQKTRRRKVEMLWGMVLLGLLYIGLMLWLHTLTGLTVLDGSIGVLLGLYICSHPAANAIDALFFDRISLRRFSIDWAGMRWFGLNILVLAVGYVVIVIGATRFAAHPL